MHYNRELVDLDWLEFVLYVFNVLAWFVFSF